MHASAVAALRCPHCASGLHLDDRTLACDTGHRFDLARQGYVNLVAGGGTPHAGDDAAMLDRRERVLAAGLLDPVVDAFVDAVDAALVAPESTTVLVDVGAGPGVHLARLVGDHPDRCGIALDVSKHAARRAARVHPRVVSVVADAWAGLPIADRAADVAVVAFAPRNGAELARILAPDGRLLVAIPADEHLASLRERLGLLVVDPDKANRVDTQLAPHLSVLEDRHVRWERPLTPNEAADLVGMGPSTYHLDIEQVAQDLARDATPPHLDGAVRLLTLARR